MNKKIDKQKKDTINLLIHDKNDYDIDDLMNAKKEIPKESKIDKSKLEKQEKRIDTSDLQKLVDDRNEKELINKIKNAKNENKPSNKAFHIFLSLLFTIMFLLSIVYIGYTILKFDDSPSQTQMIINSGILFIMCACMILIYMSKKTRNKRLFTVISSISLSIFFIFNILVDFKFLHLPENRIVGDFSNKSISEAMKWAQQNHIDVTQIYDNSDQIKEYFIITQDIDENTPVRDIKNITFTVSEGPDRNKEVTIANMIGWNIDDAMNEIEENYLNNVNVDFMMNEENQKDIVFGQNKNGQMKRSDELLLQVSLGDGSSLKPASLEDFNGQSLLKASVWLKRHGILYEVVYEFSDTIAKGNIIKQSIKKGTMVSPNNEKVTLYVSKGKKIIIPDLTKMSMSEVTNWIVTNKLKVRFEERYHATVKKGYIIEANYKENDAVEEGTLIEIVSSKGSLTMKKFNDLNEFRTWANAHDIKFQEEYEQNKDIEKGKIIKFSITEGTPVNTGDVITVYISTGSTIVVPNFVGKHKNSIESSCKDLGLNCTFSYGGKSSYDKDIAISQNKKANSEVIKDTYVNIVLSSGKQTNNNSNSGSNNTGNQGGNGSSNGSGGNTQKPTPTPTPPPKPSCEEKTYTVDRSLLTIFNNNSGFDKVSRELYNFFAQNYPNVKITVVGVDGGDATSGSYIGGDIRPGATIKSCNTKAYTIQIAK